jgi:hypothetical protein
MSNLIGRNILLIVVGCLVTSMLSAATRSLQINALNGKEGLPNGCGFFPSTSTLTINEINTVLGQGVDAQLKTVAIYTLDGQDDSLSLSLNGAFINLKSENIEGPKLIKKSEPGYHYELKFKGEDAVKASLEMTQDGEDLASELMVFGYLTVKKGSKSKKLRVISNCRMNFGGDPQ